MSKASFSQAAQIMFIAAGEAKDAATSFLFGRAHPNPRLALYTGLNAAIGDIQSIHWLHICKS